MCMTKLGCFLFNYKDLKELNIIFQIIPVVEKVFPFEEMPQAYEKVLNGHARGKTVVDYTTKPETVSKQEECVKV